MVNYSANSLDLTYFALAHPIRRAIIESCTNSTTYSSSIAARFDVSRPAITKHLKVLQDADLIVVRKEGRKKRIIVRTDQLEEASSWLEDARAFWSYQLDRLEDHLKEKETK